MKNKFFLLLMGAFLTTLSTYAYDFQSGDLYYSITSDNTVEVADATDEITTATIPATVTYNGIKYSVIGIGSNAFSYCSALTSITIPKSVTSIGDGAFRDCTSLSSITIPNSVTSIGDKAFYYCTKLTSITIPKSVTNIGKGVFGDCNSLTSIVVESGNTIYDSRDNSNAIIETTTNTLIAGCKSTTIPNTITSIGEYAFYYCTSLTSIIIPNYVTTIKNRAFYRCTSLTTVSIGSSVTEIKDWAFSLCSSLDTITCEALVPPTCGFNCFDEVPNTANVRVPSIAYEAYLNAAPWNQFNLTIMQYTLQVKSSNETYGSAQIDQEVDSEGIATISATANYGYHFVQWSDGNTDNPRTIQVSENTTLTAEFAKNQYTITTICNAKQGSISGAKVAEYLDNVTLTAIANSDYYFVQWADGNTDNPRSFILTQDTTFTVEFAGKYEGKCGDNLYWTYRDRELQITGSGEMYNYTKSTVPWASLRDSILTVRIGNNATSVGNYAFADTQKMTALYIGAKVDEIGAYAFSGCKRLYDIYCYPAYPPLAEAGSFENYTASLYIPCESQNRYTLHEVWGKFQFIECIGAVDASVYDEMVTVSAGYVDATFTWPLIDKTETYSLVITQDSKTVCTLVFNAQGQLTSITFKPQRQNAPAAEGTTDATHAEQASNGFRFMVTGLERGTAYSYTLTAADENGRSLKIFLGKFTTLGEAMGIFDADASPARQSAEKVLRDGQVLIIRNSVTYDMMGQTL